MGMVNWIKGVVTSVLPASLTQGAEREEQRAKPKLLDLADGYYLVEEAKKLGLAFFRKSRLDLDDLRTRVMTRRKVRRHLADFYDLPEIVDEVTEKIVETTREDSYLKRMFG